nr:MAG TPA: hypothetical protein [Caudoviricetes sp.]
MNKCIESMNNFYTFLNNIINLDFTVESNRLILATSNNQVMFLNKQFQYHLKALLLQSIHNRNTISIINMLQDISLHINERVNHYNSLCIKMKNGIDAWLYDIMYNKLWSCKTYIDKINKLLSVE